MEELEVKEVKAEKYVVVFVKIDDKGKFDCGPFNFVPPYGYHHIIKFYKQGDFGTCATVTGSIQDIEKIRKIAEIIADGIEVEIDPEFYIKYNKWLRSQK